MISSHFLLFLVFFFGSIGSIPPTVVAVRRSLWLFLTISLTYTSEATFHNYTRANDNPASRCPRTTLEEKTDTASEGS